jgi:hypothetical protein
MKARGQHAAESPRLGELRRREKELAIQPSAEGYLDLAAQYRLAGMAREADRLLQLAEGMENLGKPSAQATQEGLLSGTANPLMIAEVIQILSRAQLSGEFVIVSPNDRFQLYFNQGHIINAHSQQCAPGLESFRQSLRVANGTYQFLQKTIEGVPTLIDEQTEVLLLNAMQDADEATAPNP